MKSYKIAELFFIATISYTLSTMFQESAYYHWQFYAIILCSVGLSCAGVLEGLDDDLR
jgi:hypothetical protein